MKYELMHKNVHVLDMNLDDENDYIVSIGDVYSFEHLPVGTFQKTFLNGTDFKNWWHKRSIPASRSGIKDVLDYLDIPFTLALLTKCLGLSLSDQYWVRLSGSDTQWEDVNFFDNGFSEDIGDLLFGHQKAVSDIDLKSPDNTSDGVLKKRWKIIDGKHYLIKSGGGPAIQEPFNEVIASELMDALKIEHAQYDLIWIDGRPCCKCEDFIDRDSELITASNLLQSYGDKKSESIYKRYLGCCEQQDLDVSADMEKMIVIDYIMLNTDRHLNNFGLIRDANTLEYNRAAPIFDTGTSLGCNLLTSEFSYKISKECRPFKKTFDEQIDMVTSFDWIDIGKLHSSLSRIESILQTNDFIPEDRIDAIMQLISSRINRLEKKIA